MVALRASLLPGSYGQSKPEAHAAESQGSTAASSSQLTATAPTRRNPLNTQLGAQLAPPDQTQFSHQVWGSSSAHPNSIGSQALQPPFNSASAPIMPTYSMSDKALQDIKISRSQPSRASLDHRSNVAQSSSFNPFAPAKHAPVQHDLQALENQLRKLGLSREADSVAPLNKMADRYEH